MSPPWASSNRRSGLPANWDRIRQQILQRDSHRCQWRMELGGICGEHATDVDHINAGDDHRPENLQALCDWHHKRKTSAQGNYSPNRTRVSQKRPPEQHPGLL